MRQRRGLAALMISVYTAVPCGAAPKAAPAAVNPSITIAIDAAASRHAIDPRIYGASFASSAAITDLGLTINRWGGNAMSTYNWSISTANRCKDYYFENIGDQVAGDGSNGESADAFIQPTLAAGAQALMTVPMLPLLPSSRTFGCSFPISVYGAQDDHDPGNPDCGNGKSGGKRLLGVNPPATSTYSSFTSAHQADWIQHNVNTFGTASTTGVKYYGLDNEPVLWSFDHWDVHPTGSTYDEEWAKWSDYGPAIKAVDPGALLTGPEEWGWSGFFDSGIDAENGNIADYTAHNSIYLIEWLLQQAKAYEQAHGLRILDFLTVHYYPQGDGAGNQEFSTDTSTTTQLLRNRSTRSLWDPTYIDQSWIGTSGIDNGIVKLIPRLKTWVANNYPGTKTGLTEYNWGADNHINGGTAQADILGILGREGLDMAVRWDTPPTGSYTSNAFKMVRNYDGAHSGFGDTSISASEPDTAIDNVSAFAAIRSTDNTLTIMLDAKTLSGDTPATVNIANFTPAAGAVAQRWQLDAGNVITRLADVTPAGSSLSLTLPAQSITMLVLPGATGAAAPAGFAATATSTSNVHLTWTAVGGVNYEIWRSSAGAPFSLLNTVAASPYDDAGLAANTTYVYKLRVATPQFSPFVIDAATTIMFTDDPVSTGMTAKAVHITELRTAVNAMRAAAGLTAQVFTDAGLASGTTIRAAHVNDLRSALNQARSTIGLPVLAYTDSPTVTANATAVKAAHIIELRNGVK